MPKISIALSTGTNMSCSQSLTIFYMLVKIKMFQEIIISINVKNIIAFGVNMEPKLLLLGDISHRTSHLTRRKYQMIPRGTLILLFISGTHMDCAQAHILFITVWSLFLNLIQINSSSDHST